MNERVVHLWKVLKQQPYKAFFLVVSVLYVLFILAVYTYMYNGSPFAFYTSFPHWYTVSATILNLVASVLMGAAIALFIAKIKELHAKSAGLGITGIAVGSLAAGCPGCFFGLFPVFLSFFGITGTLAILPLNGIELQLLTVLLLGLSIYFLAKETDITCEI